MRAIIRFKRVGAITIELYGREAPTTVINFTDLIEKGFYEGTIVHRLVKDQVIQTGSVVKSENRLFSRQHLDPQGNEVTIRNESYNGLSNLRGMVAMARESYLPDSASTQFFINLQDNTHLDYREGYPGYCVFGRVVGMDSRKTIEALNKLAVTDGGYPVKTVAIEKAFTERR